MRQTAGPGGTTVSAPSSHLGGIPESLGVPREVLNMLPRQGVCLCSSKRCWHCLLPLLVQELPVMNQHADLSLSYLIYDNGYDDP